MSIDIIKKRLFEMRNEKYRDFQCSLMPTVDRSTVIGVRTPKLRAYAKEIAGTNLAESFLSSLPHQYYEENNLHAFLIEQIKNYEKCISALNDFLPFIDNWATCDSMTPKVFENHPNELLEQIKIWCNTHHTYTVRYGIKTLMAFYLDDYFSPEHLKFVSDIKNDEYYVKMAVAWYFATALAKQYKEALPYIKNKVLDTWTHNKTIQKSIESYRISEEEKEYLRNFKI